MLIDFADAPFVGRVRSWVSSTDFDSVSTLSLTSPTFVLHELLRRARGGPAEREREDRNDQHKLLHHCLRLMNVRNASGRWLVR